MPITAARDNPYDPQSFTLDLTKNTSQGNPKVTGPGFRYYTWVDRNGDGVFDDGEETEHLIKDAPSSVQQNFANWFSYYRKRSYVAKAVYGNIIHQLSGMRTALVTFHDNRDIHDQPLKPYSPNACVSTVNLPLQDIDTTAHVPKATAGCPAQSTRRTMLDALYSFRPGEHPAGGDFVPHWAVFRRYA